MTTDVQQPPTPPAATRHASGIRQLVGFRLDQEEYGIEITKVREIILPGEITRIPCAPPYVAGLINLRNTVLPVVNLRRRFGLPEQSPTEATRIVVVAVQGKTMGLVVDAVTEVFRIGREQIAPPPPTVAGGERAFLTGLAQLDQRLSILLDIDHLLGDAL